MPRNRLQPGQDTIDAAKIKEDPRGGYRMRWSICLPDGLTLKRDTRGAMTKGELRAKARRQAAELRQTCGRRGAWTTADSFDAYLKEEAIPSVESNARLRENSKSRYVQCLRIAAEELGRYPIVDALHAGTFGRALTSIACAHGTATARQVRKVVNRWVIQPLIMAGVLSANPIAGLSFDLPEVKASNKPAGGRGLSEAEWEVAVQWLLSDDWAKIASEEAPIRGRYTRQQLAEARRAVVELTLLQATTGLRVGEARSITWNEVSSDCSTIEVTDEASKTHRGRIVPVLDERVKRRLAKRRKDCGGAGLVFPSPAAGDPGRRWDKSNCSKAVSALYEQMADECGIDLLRTARSHVWRSTLHTIARDRGVPIEVRAALFGHDPETARRYYTDTQDVSGVADLFTRSN